MGENHLVLVVPVGIVIGAAPHMVRLMIVCIFKDDTDRPVCNAAAVHPFGEYHSISQAWAPRLKWRLDGMSVVPPDFGHTLLEPTLKLPRASIIVEHRIRTQRHVERVGAVPYANGSVGRSGDPAIPSDPSTLGATRPTRARPHRQLPCSTSSPDLNTLANCTSGSLGHSERCTNVAWSWNSLTPSLSAARLRFLIVYCLARV